MPAMRIVMPNGTTKSFPEGTSKKVITEAMRAMLRAMHGERDDHEAYRKSRRVTVTQNRSLPKDGKEREIPEGTDAYMDVMQEVLASPPQRQQESGNRLSGVPYLTPEEEQKIRANPSLEVAGNILDIAGNTAAAYGVLPAAGVAKGAGFLLGLEPVRGLLDDMGIGAVNKLRELQAYPPKPDWLLRKLAGDQRVDELNAARNRQAINNMIGNAALKRNSGF